MTNAINRTFSTLQATDQQENKSKGVEANHEKDYRIIHWGMQKHTRHTNYALGAADLLTSAATPPLLLLARYSQLATISF